MIESNQGTEELRTNDAIYQRIKRAILENRLPPGTKLAEGQLSRIFGVSREHVRKILDKLAHDKCVERKPNRGAYVAKPTVEEAQSVFAARLIIEPHLLDLVAENAEERDYEELLENIRCEMTAHAEDHLNEAIALSGDFHLLLARASGNEVLSEILRDLIARSSLVIATYGWRRYSLCSYSDHENLLDALRSGRLEQAKVLMSEHLEEIAEQLRLDAYPVAKVDLADIFPGE